jgi:8-oxo-dGTP pyrophosphatase MutT (NUDIX family)
MDYMDDDSDPNIWKKVSSNIVYQSPFMTVREDQVATDSGKKGIYNLIDPRPGVLVIAETETDEIYLIEAFRYPLQEWRWELPGGGIENGDTPLVAAKKELQEELGLIADEWEQIGDIYPSHNGPMSDRNIIFVAHSLTKTSTAHESGEAIRPPQAISYDKVFDMVRDGELTDGQTLGALLYYKLWREAQLSEDNR